MLNNMAGILILHIGLQGSTVHPVVLLLNMEDRWLKASWIMLQAEYTQISVNYLFLSINLLSWQLGCGHSQVKALLANRDLLVEKRLQDLTDGLPAHLRLQEVTDDPQEDLSGEGIAKAMVLLVINEKLRLGSQFLI